MRGQDEQQVKMYSYMSLEEKVSQKHPLRRTRVIVDKALSSLSDHFDKLYSSTGRPSVAPEKLIRALLLQLLYGVRSIELLMEEIDYSLLFRWFVGLNIDDEVWDATVFSKNRERLLGGEVPERFFQAVVGQLEEAGLLSDEHFTVDGTMLEAWANRRSFHEKPEVPKQGSGWGGAVLLRDKVESKTDPDVRLYKKTTAGEAKSCYLGHVLTENRNGLVVSQCVTRAGTAAEREAALELLKQRRKPKKACTLGADKQYQEPGFVQQLRQRQVTPHVAEYEKGVLQARNSLLPEERGSPGFAVSQQKRKLVEQVFGWQKQWAGIGKVKLRGIRKVDFLFTFACSAYNLMRMQRLLTLT